MPSTSSERASVAFALEEFANLAVCQKDAERATRLIAWANTAGEARQGVRPISEQKDVERDIAAIRAMIDVATFDAAYEEGKAMTAEEAIAYALQREV